MKKQNTVQLMAAAVMLLGSPVVILAGEADDPARRVRLQDPEPVEKDRFGISYRASFNITAQFKNVGVAPGVGKAGSRGPGRAASGVDHFYDDGYVRVDSTHSGSGYTWFWGYKDAGQIQPNDTLAMHSSSVVPIKSTTTDDDPQHGMEVTYNRELGRSEKHNWSWGLEAAFGWTDIDLEDHRPLSGGVRMVTDAYDLGGIDPNVPPYSTEYPGHAGNYEGPGPLLDDRPSRSISFSASGASVTGKRRFEADLFTWRLGPYIEFPIDEHWTFGLSAGAALGLVDGEFWFSQLVSTPAGRNLQRGRGSNSDLVFGGYVGGTIRYAINERWSLFASGQYLGLTGYSAEARGQKVEMDFARTASGIVGLSFSF